MPLGAVIVLRILSNTQQGWALEAHALGAREGLEIKGPDRHKGCTRRGYTASESMP